MAQPAVMSAPAAPTAPAAPAAPTTSAARQAPTASKSQQVYEYLREQIADGRYTAGYRLVLSQIAAEVGVSVVPVREAIRRLEAENLVTFTRNVGAHVASIDPQEYLHTMQTLSLVEGMATRMAAASITAEQVARARALNAEMAACLADFDPTRFTALNNDFHSVLYEECPNPHILSLVHRGWHRMKLLRGSTFSFVPGRAHESVTEHEQLLRLLEDGAGELEIELAARDHRMATLDAFLTYQQEHGAPSSIPTPEGA